MILSIKELRSKAIHSGFLKAKKLCVSEMSHHLPSHPTQSILNLQPSFDPTTKRVVIVTTSTYYIPTHPTTILSLPPSEQPTELLPNNPTSSSRFPTTPHVITGYSLPDVIHPFNLLRSMGVNVEIASIEGGKVLNDPTTDHFIDENDVVRSVFHNPFFRELIENTKQLSSYLCNDPNLMKKDNNNSLNAETDLKHREELTTLKDSQAIFRNDLIPSSDSHHQLQLRNDAAKPAHIDALLFAGGYGCMWDFPFHPTINELGRQVYEQSNGIIACIGHGSAALLNIYLSNGDLLVKGRECTGTTNEEEFNNHRLALYPKHSTRGIPFETPSTLSRLEDLLRNAEANFRKADMLTSFTVIDKSSGTGKLITGQNCNSAQEVAEQLLHLLSEESSLT